MLDEITATYHEIAREIAQRENLLIVAPKEAQPIINFQLSIINSNDTWARDHGFITLTDDEGHHRLLDFCFNGWGEKFPAELDNAINRRLYDEGKLGGDYVDCLDFVLEGGSIESDGRGTVFTTTGCLLAPHRNQPLTKEQIEERLKRELHAERILWIDHGNLTGDDTDGHIDTLVRICPDPATYANFLIINDAVLCPTYAQPDLDAEALRIIGEAFTDREIVGIDCRSIIKQHGSLHCCTMQFPAV